MENIKCMLDWWKLELRETVMYCISTRTSSVLCVIAAIGQMPDHTSSLSIILYFWWYWFSVVDKNSSRSNCSSSSQEAKIITNMIVSLIALWTVVGEYAAAWCYILSSLLREANSEVIPFFRRCWVWFTKSLCFSLWLLKDSTGSAMTNLLV